MTSTRHSPPPAWPDHAHRRPAPACVGSLPKADGYVAHVPQVYTQGKGNPVPHLGSGQRTP